MSRAIGAVVTRKMASPHELQTVYGAQDLYDMLEIIVVNDYNERALSKQVYRLGLSGHGFATQAASLRVAA